MIKILTDNGIEELTEAEYKKRFGNPEKEFENGTLPPTVEERLQAVESVIADIMIMQIGGESDV